MEVDDGGFAVLLRRAHLVVLEGVLGEDVVYGEPGPGDKKKRTVAVERVETVRKWTGRMSVSRTEETGSRTMGQRLVEFNRWGIMRPRKREF